MDTSHFQKIKRFYLRQGRMPTYTEIMDLIGFRSKDSVFKLINRLETGGFLRKDRTGKIIPRNMFDLRMLGIVEAGFPTAAEELTGETITLDEFLIGNKEASFMLTVKGESMRDAGIFEGDMVIVERGAQAKVGDIVIAEVDGDYTIKYLRSKNGKLYLDPANPDFKPIYPENELSIAAVVRSVIRKFA